MNKTILGLTVALSLSAAPLAFGQALAVQKTESAIAAFADTKAGKAALESLGISGKALSAAASDAAKEKLVKDTVAKLPANTQAAFYDGLNSFALNRTEDAAKAVQAKLVGKSVAPVAKGNALELLKPANSNDARRVTINDVKPIIVEPAVPSLNRVTFSNDKSVIEAFLTRPGFNKTEVEALTAKVANANSKGVSAFGPQAADCVRTFQDQSVRNLFDLTDRAIVKANTSGDYASNLVKVYENKMAVTTAKAKEAVGTLADGQVCGIYPPEVGLVAKAL